MLFRVNNKNPDANPNELKCRGPEWELRSKTRPLMLSFAEFFLRHSGASGNRRLEAIRNFDAYQHFIFANAFTSARGVRAWLPTEAGLYLVQESCKR
ncbi:hypothetical protein E4U42_007194, partial [Claviceps africana]